jgi:hypothetical protein
MGKSKEQHDLVCKSGASRASSRANRFAEFHMGLSFMASWAVILSFMVMFPFSLVQAGQSSDQLILEQNREFDCVDLISATDKRVRSDCAAGNGNVPAPAKNKKKDSGGGKAKPKNSNTPMGPDPQQFLRACETALATASNVCQKPESQLGVSMHNNITSGVSKMMAAAGSPQATCASQEKLGIVMGMLNDGWAETCSSAATLCQSQCSLPTGVVMSEGLKASLRQNSSQCGKYHNNAGALAQMAHQFNRFGNQAGECQKQTQLAEGLCATPESQSQPECLAYCRHNPNSSVCQHTNCNDPEQSASNPICMAINFSKAEPSATVGVGASDSASAGSEVGLAEDSQEKNYGHSLLNESLSKPEISEDQTSQGEMGNNGNVNSNGFGMAVRSEGMPPGHSETGSGGGVAGFEDNGYGGGGTGGLGSSTRLQGMGDESSISSLSAIDSAHQTMGGTLGGTVGGGQRRSGEWNGGNGQSSSNGPNRSSSQIRGAVRQVQLRDFLPFANKDPRRKLAAFRKAAENGGISGANGLSNWEKISHRMNVIKHQLQD